MRDNTLTANYEYSRIDRENLALPNSGKISKKLSTFFAMIFAFLESELNFQCFEKKKWAS